MKKILVINGPNLNFLGIREKSIYGTENYSALLGMIQKHAADLGIAAECWQSNHEGAIIDKLQEAYFDEDLIEAFLFRRWKSTSATFMPERRFVRCP